MDDVKIRVIDSDKLVNAINEGSYDVNLSAVIALGAVMLDTKKQEVCEYCHTDTVPRTSVEYICEKNTVSTNPYEHKYHDKFMQFIDDSEISDFGRWQHSNGFNAALVAVKCDLDKVPSAQTEIVRCRDCIAYQEGIDIDGKPFTRCNGINGSVRTYGHTPPDWYCADAERRTDE